jgi:hypothetical protein
MKISMSVADKKIPPTRQAQILHIERIRKKNFCGAAEIHFFQQA